MHRLYLLIMVQVMHINQMLFYHISGYFARFVRFLSKIRKYFDYYRMYYLVDWQNIRCDPLIV